MRFPPKRRCLLAGAPSWRLVRFLHPGTPALSRHVPAPPGHRAFGSAGRSTRGRGRANRWRRLGSRLVLVVLASGGWLLVGQASEVAWADTIDITPSWEGAPWVAKVQTLLNVTSQAALVCCAVAFVLGGAAMGIGRVVGSNQYGNRGLQFLLGGAAGAIVIVSTPSIITWLTS